MQKPEAPPLPPQGRRQQTALEDDSIPANQPPGLSSSKVVGKVADTFEIHGPATSFVANVQGTIRIGNESHFSDESLNEFGINGGITNLQQPAKAVEEVVDGWEDDGIDDFEDPLETPVASIVDTSPANQEHGRRSEAARGETVRTGEPGLFLELNYNPEDDIIETRKRWRNERPFRPYVTS